MNRIINTNYKFFVNYYHSSVGVYGFIPRPLTPRYIVSELAVQNRKKNYNLYQLSEAFKKHGCYAANINPLQEVSSRNIPELDPANYDLDIKSNCEVSLEGILHVDRSSDTLRNVIQNLEKIYCDKIGLEFSYVNNEEKEWLAAEFERIQTQSNLLNSEKKELANELIKSQTFDNFLATKFSSVKRYGGEGAESMMAFFMEIFKSSALSDLQDVMIGIPHRGRLNLLTGLLQFPPVEMFQKMMGFPEFPNTRATCDVLSHLTASVDYNFNQKSVHVTLLPNPSHLEAVSPVVVGYARSRLQSLRTSEYGRGSGNSSYPVLPVQVHGDASFSGQGVVMETLAISKVPNFSVGGSIHLIVNNQIGFTTPLERGSSSKFCSDLMKMISAPVIHVNGDFPEEVLKAAKLAFNYRQTFNKDILVDMLCFRRWGHNELDDPTFTNPMMYKIIHSRKSVPDLYASQLIADKVLTEEECAEMHSNYHNVLSENLKLTESYKIEKNFKQNEELINSLSVYDTGVSADVLKFIGAKSVQLPEHFSIHPTLRKNFAQEREKKLVKGNHIDWATAEALAFGSLLYQGHNVRLSGQDVGRGTFSHRHAMLVDQSSGEIHVPLNHITENQAAFLEFWVSQTVLDGALVLHKKIPNALPKKVANSILSEEGVLSFEYGFSVENTNNLVIWEAQFGDFFNSAQVVFDTFISSGERKWMLPSRIVILLPHGYDGAGPEHSSCRLERFLQMSDSHESQIDSDDVNWHIVNPTTPAQYFHLLRHQVFTQVPKPLIVVAPKILIRHPQAISSLKDMEPRSHFKPVLDSNIDPKSVKKLIFCSGKHYYLLEKEKENRKIEDCAIVRLEKLCPFPTEKIYDILKKYKNAKTFLWSQEEHQNMGAWTFIQARFQNLLGCKLKYAGRKPMAAIAVGAGKYHQEEIEKLIKDTFDE